MYFISDVADDALRTLVLDGATDASYKGAQNRSLKGLQHAVRAAPSARWIWMVDDDTYFNIEEAVSLVRWMQHAVPVIVGHVFRGILRFRQAPGTWPSGGGGMLLSRAAAHAIAGNLFSPACPWQGLNDEVIGKCAYALQIPMLHHSGFQPEMEGRTLGDLKSFGGVAEMAGAITHHMLAEMYVIEALQRELLVFKTAPFNDTLNWQHD